MGSETLGEIFFASLVNKTLLKSKKALIKVIIIK